MKKALMLALSLSLALSTSAIFAAEENGHESHAGGHDRHVSIFNGVTTTIDPVVGHYYTVGADYERFLFGGFAGLGLLLDVASDGQNPAVVIAALPISIHPIDHLRIFVAPGYELGAHGHNVFMVRAGIGYDFNVEGIYFTPMVSFDYLMNGHMSLVYGLAVGAAF